MCFCILNEINNTITILKYLSKFEETLGKNSGKYEQKTQIGLTFTKI